MWTRNYNNLLNSVISTSTVGTSSVSTKPFDDTYTGNFKNPLGYVYEICTYFANSRGSSSIGENYFVYTRAALVPYNTNAVITTLTSLSQIQSDAKGYFYSGYRGTGGQIFVAFGNGQRAESYEDYMLDGSIINSFITNSRTVTVGLNTDCTYTMDYRIILTATSDFTIREIGIFLPVAFCEPSGASSCSYFALINRIVLDEPISAKNEEVVHVEFSITTPKITISG